MVIRCFLIFFIALLPHTSWAINKLSSSIDKNPVLVGEYFTLTIEADGKVNGDMPDISLLQKDFNTGPVSTGSRTSIVNGSVSSSTTWQLQLIAKSEGRLTIPAFEVAGIKSQPISVQVVAREENDEESEDIFIKTSLNPNSLYVQQAGVYTVKLYLGKDLLDGKLSSPELDEATFSMIEKQKEDYEIIDGKRYMVVTREYLVQPQKSGQFTIIPPALNGQIREGYRRLAVSAVAEPTELIVKPIPDGYLGTWLPSELVHIGEELTPDSTSLTVGEPITRTLTLTAVGVTKEQLPDIDIPKVPGFRSYPDEVDRKQITRDGKVISQVIASYALMPKMPGNYSLPEIKVPWFNTITNQIDYAILPAKSITVVANPDHPTQDLGPTQNVVPSNPAAVDDHVANSSTQQAIIPSSQIPIITYGGYVLWVITLAIWALLNRRQKSSVKVAEETQPSYSSTDALKALKIAAKSKNHQAFYNSLLAYSKGEYHNFNLWRLDQSEELQSEVQKLQEILYGGQTHTINLDHLVKLIEKKSTFKSSNKSKLDPLY